MRDLTRPDALEIAAGMMLGRVPGVSVVAKVAPGNTRRYLEQVVARALARPPCVVSFSGGRDSSAVLAIAASVARRDGYELPVPTTMVYPGQPATDEGEWQRLVLDHLHLREWNRIAAGPEVDLVGPMALDVLHRHGILFPANAYLHSPILNVARGGSLLCGIGGDEVLDSPALPVLRWLRGYERPSRRGLTATWDAIGPANQHRMGRQVVAERPWLRPDAAATARARAGAAVVALGPHWGGSLRRWAADRYYLAMSGSLTTIAEDYSVEVVAPFLDRTVMAGFAADGGWCGFESRAAVLARLVGDDLPSAIISRASKAIFTNALRSQSTAELVDGWDGSGLDPNLVDAERLRTMWRDEVPDARTSLLLQQLALARSRARGQV